MAGLELETLLSPLKLDPRGPRVAAIGGGHGLAVCLEALQRFASDITAIVSVADDGGSSGRLTSGLGIPPPGDIRKALLALTPEPTVVSELFGYRFEGGPDDPADLTPRDVEGHALGNLMLAALTELTGDFARAVLQAGELLGAVGRVVPTADRPIRMAAMVGGRRVEGQVAVARARGGVERLELGPPDIHAHEAALEAIAAADQIVLGPGSLYTSTIASLAVPGIADAVERSPARLVFVLNLVTQDGETLGMSGADHLWALHRQVGIERKGTVVMHAGDLDVPAGLSRVELSVQDAYRMGWALHRSYVSDDHVDWPAHDPVALGLALASIS